MNRRISFICGLALTLFGMAGPARAEQLRYKCVDNEGPFPLIIDTSTKSALIGEPDMKHGRATITNGSISITLDSDPNYRGRINRRTGVLVDTDGNGTCSLIK